jgi:hypothetical protein
MDDEASHDDSACACTRVACVLTYHAAQGQPVEVLALGNAPVAMRRSLFQSHEGLHTDTNSFLSFGARARAIVCAIK